MKIFENKFFFKILSLFLIVIFSLSISYSVVRISDIKKIKKTTVDMMYSDFENGAVNFQKSISRIQYAMADLSVKFAAKPEFETGRYIDNNILRADMRSVLLDERKCEFAKYISTAFVIDTQKPEYVYEITDTYTSEKFFANLFISEKYGYDFWNAATVGGELFSVLPAEVFGILKEGEEVHTELMPISYKPQVKSRYLIVVLVDISSMSEDFEISGIKSKNDELLYVDHEAGEYIKNKRDFERLYNEGRAFEFVDGKNDVLKAFKFISEDQIGAASEKTDVVFGVVSVILFILSVLFSILVSWKLSKHINLITKKILSNSQTSLRLGNEIRNFSDLFKAINFAVSHDIKDSHDGKTGDSLLDLLLVKPHLQDEYEEIGAITKKVRESESFFVVYFRVTYLDALGEYAGEDCGKATLLLRQLVEMYLEKYDIPSKTFQVNKNGILSVFDTSIILPEREEIIEYLTSKLANESEFAVFTIVVSEVYTGTDKFKTVYDSVVDLSKYAKTSIETQVLWEGEVQKGASRFYFSLEEMGKLSAILQSGTDAELKHKIHEIIDFNVKKEINRFEMYLLCTEIINCAVKLVNRVIHSIPDNINLADVYSNLEEATTSDEYRRICDDFLIEIMKYVHDNKREDDYIISFILDYVDNHFSEDIYLNLFAEKLKLTGAYISSYFKEKMNVNLSDYINNYRIKKAISLCENPQNKNKDIAVMVGLPNINTFIRLFKKYTGYTPGEYKKKHFGKEYNK